MLCTLKILVSHGSYRLFHRIEGIGLTRQDRILDYFMEFFRELVALANSVKILSIIVALTVILL